MSPKISVVIGSYNQGDILKKVLPFYEKQTCHTDDFEVIIVDSTSQDGAQDFLKSYQPNFTFRYHIQENKGKASARNKGVELARGEYILITDGDMIPDKSLVEEHIKAHQLSPSPCSFEGLAWNLESLVWPPQRETMKAQVGKHPKDMSKLGWYYFLTGNISLPKSIFMSNKGFNEIFMGYGWEDLELGYRLEKKSIPLYYLKSAVNYHYHVITKEEEIERNINKGKSAQTLLKLHPELKLFLGLNPISKFIFPRIKETGCLYKWIKMSCFPSSNSLKHKFGYWFLKEYNYLKGLIEKVG
ncbi:hypothetical protein DID78_03080 [Candidatus Marinamargulisbacteria bacterium SCGC AG-343-D04]|nr:hypothetical protein DID78_03080 [Candidatus Marinamargulisbacteria bacterium SCGC AG-343-D04]